MVPIWYHVDTKSKWRSFMEVIFSGRTVHEIALQARDFAASVLEEGDKARNEDWSESQYGYRPGGVGRPTLSPVDDGTEWTEPVLNDWIQRLNPNGRRIVALLAKNQIIDPRRAAPMLGWPLRQWSGYSMGPRNQAGMVMRAYGLKSWPYGHSDDVPVRLWMHPNISRAILRLLGVTPNEILSTEIAVMGQTGGSFAWLAEDPELYTLEDGEPV